MITALLDAGRVHPLVMAQRIPCRRSRPLPACKSPPPGCRLLSHERITLISRSLNGAKAAQHAVEAGSAAITSRISGRAAPLPEFDKPRARAPLHALVMA